MRRLALEPRPNLGQRVTELGFTYQRVDGTDYWDETACYAFGMAEIENELEAPTTDLAALCLDLVEFAVRDYRKMLLLGVPRHFMASVVDSWNRRDPTLYGRFDFAYDGTGPAKLLEYNADTPTSLFESAVFQWFWLEDLRKAGVLSAHAAGRLDVFGTGRGLSHDGHEPEPVHVQSDGDHVGCQHHVKRLEVLVAEGHLQMFQRLRDLAGRNAAGQFVEEIEFPRLDSVSLRKHIRIRAYVLQRMRSGHMQAVSRPTICPSGRADALRPLPF